VRGVNYFHEARWSRPVHGDEKKKLESTPILLASSMMPGKRVNPGNLLEASQGKKKTRHPAGYRVLMNCKKQQVVQV